MLPGFDEARNFLNQELSVASTGGFKIYARYWTLTISYFVWQSCDLQVSRQFTTYQRELKHLPQSWCGVFILQIFSTHWLAVIRVFSWLKWAIRYKTSGHEDVYLPECVFGYKRLPALKYETESCQGVMSATHYQLELKNKFWNIPILRFCAHWQIYSIQSFGEKQFKHWYLVSMKLTWLGGHHPRHDAERVAKSRGIKHTRSESSYLVGKLTDTK